MRLNWKKITFAQPATWEKMPIPPFPIRPERRAFLRNIYRETRKHFNKLGIR